MNKTFLKKTTIILSFLIFGAFLVSPNVYADTLCPSYMDPDSRECLDYLRKQLSNINSQLSSIEKKLKAEEYAQLSLQEKIAYTTKQIAETERVIESLQIEIAAKDVEINIFSKEIKTKEDDISLLSQEINTLKETVNKRVTESYKFSFVTAFELFLDVRNIETVLRKTKYLLETREKDRLSLQQYNLKVEDLEEEELVLANQKLDLQKIRNENETEKERLVEQKKELDAQKSERTRLLAESQKREESLVASFEANRSKQAAIDDAIMKYIQEHGDQMANYGWVSKGTWIGRMGGAPNGCSTGYHIHFAIDRIGTSYYDGFGEIDPWAGYLRKGPDYWRMSLSGWKYYYVRSGTMGMPLGGTVVLTQDHHSSVRKAIDIYSLNGYGANVYAAMEGTLYKGKDRCGDTYAVVKHPNGLRTAYYHLQ